MSQSDEEARLQQLAGRLVDRRKAHNVVLGMQSGEGRLNTAAAGFADAGRTVPMASDTPYFLASITKMYTAVVVMGLAKSGEVGLDAPISQYLAADLTDGLHVIDGTDHSGQITVAQLLNQTSGLADYFEGEPPSGRSLVVDLREGRDRALTIEDITEIVRGLRPEFAPGAKEGRKAHYSDTNYALLGAIIEGVTGATVGDNFDRMIFSPLGLTGTYVFDHTQTRPSPAAMYFKDRTLEIPLAMSSFAPDGGVVSTLDESLRFLRAFFGGELLDENQLTWMTRQWNRIFFPLQYGSGLMRFTVPRWMSPLQAPPDLIGHSGSTGSFGFWDPKRAVYLAGTLNQMENPGRPYRVMTKMLGLLD